MTTSKFLDSHIHVAVLASIPEPFFVFDENGYYVQILGGADKSKYHDGQHLIGKRIHDVIDKKLADEYLVQIKKAIQAEKVVYHTYELSAGQIKGSETLPGPEGSQWFEAHISPVEKIQRSTDGTVVEIGNISDATNKTNDIVDSIAAAVEEQTATTREISENVNQASTGVSEVNENVAQSSTAVGDIAQEITEVNSAAAELSSSSTRVSEKSDQLAGLSSQLNELVNKFKI